MIFKDIVAHFNIEGDFPEYLYEQTFNEVFLDGKLSKNDNDYEIVVKTRQDVIHHMYLKPGEDYPLIILSELPTGLLNGMKFGQNKGEEIPISKL
ncbi:hypothetical protein [Methanobrevibacter sp.]|uniref:hypothetical protein n=1 Tax=Methanobrevibacter sp. TaxID=66852 RepID=UPI003870D9A8